jgi:hypothetical protein
MGAARFSIFGVTCGLIASCGVALCMWGRY